MDDFRHNNINLCKVEQKGKRAIPWRWKKAGTAHGLTGPILSVINKFTGEMVEQISVEVVAKLRTTDPVLLDMAHLLSPVLLIWNRDLPRVIRGLNFIWGQCPDRDLYGPTVFNLYHALKSVGHESILIFQDSARHMVETEMGALKDTAHMKFICFGDLDFFERQFQAPLPSVQEQILDQSDEQSS